MIESCQGSKVRLWLGFEARPVVLPQRQVELLSSLPSSFEPPTRLGAPPWLLNPDGLTSLHPPRREWGAAWLLLQDMEGSLSLADFTALVCTADGPGQRAACWLHLVGPQHLFRWRQGQVSARPVGDVRSLRRERRRRLLMEQREHHWLALLRARLPLDVETLSSDQRQRLEQLREAAAGRLDPEQLEPALRRSLSSLHIGPERGELRHLLVDLGQWDRHRLLSLDGTTWSQGFSAELLAEAERLVDLAQQPWPGDQGRLDLTGQHCVTIDDDDTLDIDDAVGLERRPEGRLRLWIHVADPGRLIPPDSPLDLEARRRGSSLYLAGGNLPMFPELLSNGPFSLRRGVRSAAWSLWVELDPQGEIAACGLLRSWVKPTYRLSYADADALIDLAPPEDPDLAELDQLLLLRRAWRLRHGALVLDLPEGRIRCRDGQPELEITDPGPARQLVAEAMVLAGAVAARYGLEHNLALPYRSQLPAELPAPAELASLPDGAVRFAAIKRCLSRGLMGTRPAPHFSLGLPAYVQATSPIRRYGDLVVQRQIGAHLEGGTVLSEDGLQELLEAFEPAVRQGIGIARDDQRHWQQVWFEAHRGGQWQAQFLRWLRPQDRLGLVRIEELGLDLAAESPPGAEPGALLLLRVHQVDSLRDQLRLVAAAG